MRFVVPKFIEYETKIIGPFTFGQFVYVGIAGAICFFLYFIIPFHLFVLICLALGGMALSLAFLKVNGKPLPSAIASFLIFTLSTKNYFWKKEAVMQKAYKQEKKISEEKPKEAPIPKVSSESRLNKLNNQVETNKNA